MSYDIRLVDKETGVELYSKHPHNFSGTTYCQNGTDELWINYSYNYREGFQRVFGESGIHFLEDKTSIKTWTKLMVGLKYLANNFDIEEHSPNPWQPYPADVYDAILNILKLGMLAPKGVWKID